MDTPYTFETFFLACFNTLTAFSILPSFFQLNEVYHTVGEEIRSKANHPIAIKQLVEFERVSVAKGADVDVEISLTNDSFELVNEHGMSVIYPGEHTIMLERGVEGETPVKFTFELSN